MIERVRLYWTFLSGSLWFIPMLMGAASAALAFTLLTWGGGLPEGVADYWLLYAGDAENARELMSALLSGMITMTSLVVSITMVVLTLAAGQIGPRLIRTFMRDRQTQTVLGLFLGDIVYLLVVFRTIDGEGADQVPHLAVSVGTGLSVLSLFVLLYFVHRLARSIVYDNVAQGLAADLRRTAERLLPEDTREQEPEPAAADDVAWIGLDRDGYIQSIDLDTLVAIAAREDAVLRLDVRPGHYVLARGDHVAIAPPRACRPGMAGEIRDTFTIGSERTAPQDLEQGIRQLVEIAARALSPGLNDVFTALAVIDNLSSALAQIFERGRERSVHRDADGAVRVIRATPDYDGLVGAAFDQIRQNGRGHPAVLIRIIDAIDRLVPYVRSDAQRRALQVQLDMVFAAGEDTITAERDVAILRSRHRQVCARLAR